MNLIIPIFSKLNHLLFFVMLTVTAWSKEDSTLLQRIESISDTKLRAIGRMLDGGSKYWEFHDQNKTQFWIITKTGTLNPDPLGSVDLAFGKGPSGAFAQCYKLDEGGIEEKRLLMLLHKEQKSIDARQNKEKLLLERLKTLVEFLQNRSQPMRKFNIMKSPHSLEEKYE